MRFNDAAETRCRGAPADRLEVVLFEKRQRRADPWQALRRLLDVFSRNTTAVDGGRV